MKTLSSSIKSIIFLSILNNQIAPFILRRTKSEVLRELPEKFEQVIYAPMSENQENVYNALLLIGAETEPALP